VSKGRGRDDCSFHDAAESIPEVPPELLKAAS
jgi:hypothetical protein